MTAPAHRPAELKAALILVGVILTEGCWLFVNVYSHPARFFRYAGFPPSATGGLEWLLAGLIAIVYITCSARLPSVRANLFRPSPLKLLAIPMAVVSGFCEECIFRKWFMDLLLREGWTLGAQVLASALAFGLAHAVWGLARGSIGAALRATVATGTLGFALALLYGASHREVAACVVAHALINLFAEPGLILAAVRGEMGGTVVGGSGRPE